MTPPIDTDGPRPPPTVIIEEKNGCWPFRRVRKHRTTPLTQLARSTLRPTPHPAYNDQIIVSTSEQDTFKRSPGSEDIAALAAALEKGTLFTEADIEEAKKIQRGEFT